MTAIQRADVEAALASYVDPYLNQNLFELDAIQHLSLNEGTVTVDIRLGYPARGIIGGMEQLLRVALEHLDGVDQVELSIGWNIAAHPVQRAMPQVANVKNIIAVASGKGGVGKSTTAANLALALAREGARVGVLDADIYGPSMGMMLGVADGVRPDIEGEKYFIPIPAHGIHVMSMAFLVTESTPMVWRGPMVSGALQQLLMQTRWPELDYLIVDMPPGTGDIQLTLAQKVPVTGAVIVTTPQDIALLDCKKGIEMFRKVDIPVLGVIENMSVHICSQCGHHEALFGEGGGERIAKAYDTVLLGALPLHQTIREQTDAGMPTVVAAPESEVALMYQDSARNMAALLSQRHAMGIDAGPEISISDD